MNTITDMHKKIHLFECNKKLLDYKLEYSNVPMWLLIRVELMIACIDKPEGMFIESEKKIVHRHLFQELTIRNPFFTFPKEIVYVGFSNQYMIQHENELVYDERTMPYLKMCRRTSMLISIAQDKKFKYAYNSWKSDYIIHLLASKKKKSSDRDAKTAHQFIQYLKEEFPLEIPCTQFKKIFETIMGYSKLLEGYTNVWKVYLRIINPKLVIQCNGSYLGLSQVALKLACNERHIPTAEIQHAAECINSHAHYWGEQIVNNENCKMVFPDYFLTCGSYWNKEVNLPSKKIVIGTHRKYSLNKKRNDNVLVCLVTNYVEYVDLVKYIVQSVEPGSTIYLRLHPLENTEKNRSEFKQFIKKGQIEFANDNNLEYYLSKCTYVVSCASTVVYEALTCGNIVFVPRDKMFDSYNMESIENRIYSFQTLEEFEQVWKKRKKIEMKEYNDFFDMNYRELYKSFLCKVLKKNYYYAINKNV